ncbi:MAG: glycosyltransferase family 2 protein, partial [Solirubrobacteraceae bacterium]|nr:glycosyltransferase family 2 protein [Solirubrobacteraceae bacterium]
VVGDRQTDTISEFSPIKKRLQKLGSWVVRQASETDVPDTTSGFRAYNREAALQMAVVSRFTYTLETIIQAGKLLVAVEDVPVRTNPKTRESRLFPSTWSYVRRNGISIFRIYAQYEPMRVFFTGSVILAFAALIPFTLFFINWVQGDGAGHVQSLIFGTVLFNAAVVMGALAVIGDLMHAQRIMSQRIFERVRRVELELGVAPSHYEPGATPAGQPATTGAHAAQPPAEDRGGGAREAIER